MSRRGQPARKKTARQFHAKDDHPEVRERVFTLLCQSYHDIRFYAVVRNKQAVLDVIRRAEFVDATYRYHPNNLYDTLVRRFFSGRLHYDHGRYSVYFAQRAKTDRQLALMEALKNAQRDYEAYAGVDERDPPIRFISGYPHQTRACRWSTISVGSFSASSNAVTTTTGSAGKVRCVVDLDAVSRQPGGEIYPQDNPLTGELCR